MCIVAPEPKSTTELTQAYATSKFGSCLPVFVIGGQSGTELRR